MIGGAITDLGLITNKLRQNVSDNGILPFFFRRKFVADARSFKKNH